MTLKVNSIMHIGKKTSIQNIIKWVNDTKTKSPIFVTLAFQKKKRKR